MVDHGETLTWPEHWPQNLIVDKHSTGILSIVTTSTNKAAKYRLKKHLKTGTEAVHRLLESLTKYLIVTTSLHHQELNIISYDFDLS